MPTDRLLDRIRELAPWHLDVELAPGVRTSLGNRDDYRDPDLEAVVVVDPFELRPVLDAVYPDGLAGRSFLDVGCNAGGYCFVARSLGAGRTLGFDVREHWIRQAEFLREHWPADTGGMEFRVAHLRDVDFGEGFDVTLFKGIFYHLPDPIGDLLRVCAATREMIVVDSASRSDVPENALVAHRESRSHVMSGVDHLAWIPGGPRAVLEILDHAGFGTWRVVYWQKHPPGQPEGWGRFRVAAARDAALFAGV